MRSTSDDKLKRADYKLYLISQIYNFEISMKETRIMPRHKLVRGKGFSDNKVL